MRQPDGYDDGTGRGRWDLRIKKAGASNSPPRCCQYICAAQERLLLLSSMRGGEITILIVYGDDTYQYH